ncbi:sensor histidine kinase [Flavitalea sp.]|nr:ATP-binding protein [Flavitalea sp.]
MKISTKYILFVVIVHLAALVLSFFVFIEEKWIFLVAEAFILISIYISWQIYQQLIQPLNLLVQGAEAIADRDFNTSFIETGTYEMDKLIKVYNRMMDELRIERTKQQEQHFFLEKLIHTSPTGIMVLDYDGKIEQVNPMAANLLDIAVEKLVDKQINEMDHPVLLKLNIMQSGESAMVKMAAATYKVHKSHFMDRGFPRLFVMIEVLTAEILEAEKNAYGKVIRMMAHEVNNTIGPVNSIMDSALKKISSIQGETSLSEALQIAVDRNTNLNNFMRNFADLVRLPPPRKQKVDLMAILMSTARLMETRAGEKKICFNYPDHTTAFFISADQQQLEQVLINIIKNAMESIEEAGEINFKIDPASRTLVISDTGNGIDNELAQDLFKPFFSTKKDGQGIGLTLIREVLYNHGFNFSLKTIDEPPNLNGQQKKHTNFTIHF